MPTEWVDSLDATRLLKNTPLVITWYERNSGHRFAAALVAKSKDKTYVIVRSFESCSERVRRLKLKLSGRVLRCGSIEYRLGFPTPAEAASISKRVDMFECRKLGWRHSAKKKYELMSDWRHWAAIAHRRRSDWRYWALRKVEL